MGRHLQQIQSRFGASARKQTAAAERQEPSDPMVISRAGNSPIAFRGMAGLPSVVSAQAMVLHGDKRELNRSAPCLAG